jgi:hypothetical protein
MREADIRLGQRPGTLANEFYKAKLPDSLAVFVGKNRAIPESNLGQIAALLRESGKLASIASQPTAAEQLDAVTGPVKLANLASQVEGGPIAERARRR